MEILTSIGNINLDEASNKNENAQIYHYFKSHPAALIACVSALVAITSYILNMVAETGIRKKLAYWGFSDASISVTTYSINRMVIYVLFFIIGVAILSIMTAILKRYYSSTTVLRKSEALFKILLREKKNAKRKVKKSKDKTEITDDMEEVRAQRKEIKELRQELFITLLCVVFVMFFLSWVLLCVVLKLALDNNATQGIIYAVACFWALFLCLIPICTEYTMRCNYSKQELDGFRKDKMKMKTEFSALYNQARKAKSEQLFFLPKVNQLVTNRILLQCVIFYLASIVMVVLSGGFESDKVMESKTSFEIYEDNNTKYAIVYAIDNIYYMDRAELQDGTITIDTSKHRIMTTDDIEFEHMTFAEAQRVSGGEPLP